jgi:hypothetical protein
MKSETPNSSLGFKSGINYFFIFGSDSETIHVKSQYSTSYRFTNQFLEENPSLYSDPSIIPRFQFSIYTIKNKFPSVEIELPNPKSKPSKKKESSVENWILQLYPIIQNEFKLERCFRESRIATRYLSLRDIVNPESTPSSKFLKKLRILISILMKNPISIDWLKSYMQGMLRKKRQSYPTFLERT